MITNDGENWHYLLIKGISALLRGTASNHNGDFYCLNCLHSYRTKETLKKHEKICKDHDYCCVQMPDKDVNISKYNPGEMSLKVPFMIYADLECLLGKIDTCQNDLKKSSTEKKLKICLRVIHGLHVVHLINQKTNGVITELKTVWKYLVKIWKIRQWK